MIPPTLIPAAERRVLARSPLTASARVECRRSGAGLSPNLVIDALNVSETGIRLLLREALAIDEEVQLLLHADDLPEPAIRQGKVVWSLELPAYGYYYAGVRFDCPLRTEEFQHLAAPRE